jgi:integrase
VPKPTKPLTKRAIDAAKPRPAGEFTLWGAAPHGFGLRVWPSGRKVFVIQYRNAQGRIRRLNVGEYGRLTLDQAQRKAKLLLARVDEGGDPAQERESARKGETVELLAAHYLEHHLMPKGKPRTVAEFRRLIEKRILPALGRRKVADIDRADVAKLHRSLATTPTEANRTVSLLRAILNQAERWGLRPEGSNPCRYVEKYPEQKRERFLTGEEVRRLGEALGEAESASGELPGVVVAVRLLALTGMRRSEVLGLKWEYVDAERSCFFLPDSKTGRKAVPVGPAVLELLARAPRFAGNPFVCAGARDGAALVGIDKAWRRITKRAGLEGVRIHDLRHNFASVGAAAGLGLPVLGAILGHSSPGTTARYAHLADDPRRAAAARISNEIAAALDNRPDAEVIPFHKP